MDELSPSLSEAFDTALGELGEDSASFKIPDEPVEEAEEGVEEQPAVEEPLVEADDEEVEELFADDVAGDDDIQPEDEALDIEGLTFELPGVDDPVTLQELKDGYLRQADYTRKRQRDAEVAKQNQKAIDLYSAIQADPMKVARQIAEEVGLIAPNAQPVKAVEFSVFNTQEAVEAEIEKRVEEAVKSHPAVLEANEARARNWVDSEFAKIEARHEVKLGPKSRHKILKLASEKNVGDLEVIFNHLMAQRQSQEEGTQRLRKAASSRPHGSGDAKGTEPPPTIDTVEDAFALAMAELDGA